MFVLTTNYEKSAAEERIWCLSRAPRAGPGRVGKYPGVFADWLRSFRS